MLQGVRKACASGMFNVIILVLYFILDDEDSDNEEDSWAEEDS